MAIPAALPSEEWINTQVLIKNLFAEEKYRQCIQVCRSILQASSDPGDPSHPLQDAFINFYLGLCFNEVARLMHHNSVAKAPAYEDAERHLLEALTTLPTTKDARMLCVRLVREPCNPVTSKEVPLPQRHRSAFSPTLTESGFFDRSCSRASSLMLSSPEPSAKRRRSVENRDVPPLSLLDSPRSSISDTEELESHESFAQIRTPSRGRGFHGGVHPSNSTLDFWMQRESPITFPPNGIAMPIPQRTPPRNHPAPSPRLMTPIRMGSPPRSYQPMVATTQPCTPTRPQLSLLSTNFHTSAHTSATQLSKGSRYDLGADPASPSPVSPISPSSPMSFRSSVSPVSPIATDGLERHFDTVPSSAITPCTPRKFEHGHVDTSQKFEHGHVDTPQQFEHGHVDTPQQFEHGHVDTPQKFEHEHVSTPQKFEHEHDSTSQKFEHEHDSPSQKSEHEHGSTSPITTAVTVIPPSAAESRPPSWKGRPPSFQYRECLDVAKLNRVTEHLTAMRVQLETHLKAVQKAQEQIHRRNALQRLERNDSSDDQSPTGSNRLSLPSNGPRRQRSLKKKESFWSFAPEDQKARQKKERIEAGRARKWKRERFDPVRYRNLCEKAMAEL